MPKTPTPRAPPPTPHRCLAGRACQIDRSVEPAVIERRLKLERVARHGGGDVIPLEAYASRRALLEPGERGREDITGVFAPDKEQLRQLAPGLWPFDGEVSEEQERTVAAKGTALERQPS